MTDFGRFRLSYEPPANDPYSGIIDHSVEMSISGEAELSNLLDFFASFLRATGYVFDGAIKIVNEPKHNTVRNTTDFWIEDGFSITGNPYTFGDTVSFSNSRVNDGVLNDKIVLG